MPIREILQASAFLLICISRLQAQFTEYPIVSAGGGPYGITAGPDGALWFTEYQANKIGRISTDGLITEYPLPAGRGTPYGITAGPDGALWFTEFNSGLIGRITTSGSITEYPARGAGPIGITTGPDGALWFTESLGNKIGRITTDGSSTDYPVPTPGGYPYLITSGPDGALWFTELLGGKIGRITTDGSITEFLAPGAFDYGPFGITTGSDGALWFTQQTGQIGRITTDGSFTEYPVPIPGSAPSEITAGPDGALWFADSHFQGPTSFVGRIGRITTSGSVTEYFTPAVGSGPNRITTGPDGALWFTEQNVNQIGRYAPGAETPPGECANIAGTWDATESGSYTETIAAAVETDAQTNPVHGKGTVTIIQLGCSFEYVPIIAGLISSNLTENQLVSLTRTGSVSGNNVNVTGLLALIDTVGSAQAGFTVTNLSGNTLTGTGQVSGDVITLNETGEVDMSGTYLINGQSGPFTETLTTTSTAVFTKRGVAVEVAPAALNFQSKQGAPAQSQSVQISGGTAGTAWQATAASPIGWLSVSPASGQIPASLTVAVNTDGLATGTYQGSITIQTPAGTPPSSTVSVTLTVTAGGQAGMITTLAGTGDAGFSGDGGPATSAALYSPHGITLDASGNLFIADYNNDRVRQVSSSGIITTVAGNGTQGFSGDGGPAASARLNRPRGVAVDASGNLFIADTFNDRIRMVSTSGIITTVAGDGTLPTTTTMGDGGPAASAQVSRPMSVAVDATGNLFVADSYNRIRMVSTSGIITTVAGNGSAGFSGDDGPAASAQLNAPSGVAVDVSGNLFIADTFNNRIRMVSTSGIISTVAGNGMRGFFSGSDGGLATDAGLFFPDGVAVDASGNVFIADVNDSRVREVSTSGIITTVAGNGTPGFSGDGGPATDAELYSPAGVAVDALGNLFISDAVYNRIRMVSALSSTTAALGMRHRRKAVR